MTITISNAAIIGTDNPTYQVSKNAHNVPLNTSMATASLVGRTTAGAGAFEEIAVGTGLVFSTLSLSFDQTWGDARYAQLTVVGTPKVPALTSFVVPNNYFLLIQDTLTLAGSQQCTLAGTANLILTDDFQTRSRIVLAGRGF